jgi:hypothetical protein
MSVATVLALEPNLPALVLLTAALHKKDSAVPMAFAALENVMAALKIASTAPQMTAAAMMIVRRGNAVWTALARTPPNARASVIRMPTAVRALAAMPVFAPRKALAVTFAPEMKTADKARAVWAVSASLTAMLIATPIPTIASQDNAAPMVIALISAEATAQMIPNASLKVFAAPMDNAMLATNAIPTPIADKAAA